MLAAIMFFWVAGKDFALTAVNKGMKKTKSTHNKLKETTPKNQIRETSNRERNKHSN